MGPKVTGGNRPARGQRVGCMTGCCSLYTSEYGSRSYQPRLATTDLAVEARGRSLLFLAILLPVRFRAVFACSRSDGSSVAILLLFLEGNRGAGGGTAGHRELSSFHWYDGVYGEKQRVVASIGNSLLVNSSRRQSADQISPLAGSPHLFSLVT